MCPEERIPDTGGEPTVLGLIRLARTHQSIAQALLAHAEKIGRRNSAVLPAALDGLARWNLTRRERRVAELLVEGLSNRRIARRMEISERTVKNHLHSIFYKLGVGDRTQAVIKLMRRPE
ncbi:response regulator transcription factor [Saccharothrix australiensis]|uniref:Regulatory LuxR family protein n=1 Tax=Saccharothrix australiensis TaxID=2072 RepID=A0A495VZ55_9PSEU|nr:LuxR C-terminal-related transcriptional regulator [Saccharothrix australiensis]RKT54504.1 regulatory LuxR family protein [Saccharothrix australiensis]